MGLLRASIIYLFSSLTGKSVPFLLLPVLTAYLTPSEFGLVALFQLATQFTVAFAGLSLNINIPRQFFNSNRDEMAALIFNLYVVLFISSSLYAVIILALLLFLPTALSLPKFWVLILPIIGFMSMSILFNSTLLRTREKPISFMGFEVGQALTVAILSIGLVVGLNIGWVGHAGALAASTIVFGVIALISIVNQGYWYAKISRHHIKSILGISVPLLPHALAGVIISVSDRIFIERLVGVEAVGLYSVGYYFGMVIMLFTDAFIKAWNPWFFKKMASSNVSDKKAIVRYSYLYMVALFIGVATYIVISLAIFPYIVSTEFTPASEYIPWVCIGYGVFGIYQLFFPYFVFLKRTSYVAKATVCAAIINLIGNYYLIREFGPVGAAYSTILAFGVSSIIVAYGAVKLTPMPWRTA